MVIEQNIHLKRVELLQLCLAQLDHVDEDFHKKKLQKDIQSLVEEDVPASTHIGEAVLNSESIKEIYAECRNVKIH